MPGSTAVTFALGQLPGASPRRPGAATSIERHPTPFISPHAQIPGTAMQNIILTGMPGAGKSTSGVILAKTLRMNFIDTDLVVQERAGRRLQEIIDAEGTAGFLAAEEEAVLSLRCSNTVLATGGSVVLSGRAMEHLKEDGMVVYLEISFAEMERRLRNITARGIVLPEGRGLRDMYDQRVPLYGKYADITVRSTRWDFEAVVETIVRNSETKGSDPKPVHDPGRCRVWTAGGCACIAGPGERKRGIYGFGFAVTAGTACTGGAPFGESVPWQRRE